MPLLAGQWADAILQLQNENFFGNAVLFHNGNSASNYNELIIRNDATQADLKPLESVLESAYADFLLAQSAANTLAGHRDSIIEKAALAVQFMPDLKAILNASVDHDIASATLATRFTSLSGIVDTQVTNAFKNRFNEALKQEQNLDVVAIGLGSLTANQQRTYVTYLRIFLNQYVTLALFGTMQS